MAGTKKKFLLHKAAKAGKKVDLVKDLLAKGADKDQKNNEGRTPLIVAVIEGHQNMVQCLLEQGAQMEETDDEGIACFICMQLSSII